MSPFINKWSDVEPQSKGPRVMSASEEIANLRKSPELRDRRNPGYLVAHARLTELYREVYGEALEEDSAR